MTTLADGAVSPETTTEPASVSKRKAKDGNTGAWWTRMAVTRTSSSSVTRNGLIGGATGSGAWAPNPAGRVISCGTIRVVRSLRPESRMRMLMSKAWAWTW